MPSAMRAVTPSSFADLDAWYAAAIERPDISRFLSMAKYIEFPKAEDYTGDWSKVGFLSHSGQTFLRASIDRDGSENLTISLWSLAQGMRQKIEAGCAVMFARDVLVRRYGVRYVSATVHATNKPSLALMNHIFGAPWGIEPDGAWDRMIGRMVDVHCFKHVLGSVVQ